MALKAGILFVILTALGTAAFSAPELQGAGAALKALEAKKAPGAANEGKDPASVLRRDLEAFRKQAPALAPADAAQQWLALYDRVTGLDAEVAVQQGEYVPPPGLNEALVAFPPPPAWPAVAALLEKRFAKGASISDHSMLLFAALLREDEAAQWREVAALLPLTRDQLGQQTQRVLILHEGLSMRSGDPGRIARSVELKISLQNPEAGSLELPDLVTLLGPQRAEVLLKRALVMPQTQLSVSGQATQRLAAKLALQMVAQLKAPHWSLAQSLEGGPLYEALIKRFPPAKPRPGVKPQARRFQRFGIDAEGDPYAEPRGLAQFYYLLHLIVGRRVPEATVVAAQLRGSRTLDYSEATALEALDRAGHTRAVSEFLKAALTKNPELPLWQLYLGASARLGEPTAALSLVRTTLERKDLSADTRRTLSFRLYQALLAADKVEEAVTHLRGLLKVKPSPDDPTTYELASGAGTLVRLGHVLNRPEWVTEGLAAMRESGSGSTALPDVLVEIGRPAEAEAALIDGLKLLAEQRAPGQPFMQGQELLVRLAGIYHRAGRHRDVLTLLDQAPNWGASDLAPLLFVPDGEATYLGLMAASALAAQGQREAAIGILKPMLRRQGGYDPAYQLLIELEGDRALPFLEELFAGDGFEERPLIWKAHLLLKAGKLEQAEAAARAAIAIDPSDGEQKHGNRMRVYAVLADIRAARGDQAQADLFRGAVRAIRTAEEADVLYAAGLLDRGIKLYLQALTHFQDAYCIQSRLAVQLASRGDFEKAEEHYRRAFELMPDSFGRLESHCFGCEGVFGGKLAENVADRVFKDLLVKTPQKPQVHYLMGYLRQSQGRYAEALGHFREAVKRDPDYLNAWKKIGELEQLVHVPAVVRDEAAVSLLRLDPFSRHGQRDLSGLSSLRALWNAVAENRKVAAVETPATLLPLTVSKTGLERSGMGAEQQAMMMSRYEPFGYRGQTSKSLEPGEALVQHKLVQAITGMIEEDRQRDQGDAF